jgi:capsular exopolysaccharide synthesis family protein
MSLDAYSACGERLRAHERYCTGHMSEIFDFLKKTEGMRGKGFHAPTDVPVMELRETAVTNMSEPVIDSANSEQGATENKVSSAAISALTEASLKVKTVLDPHTPVGEQFRLLRSKLGLMQKQRGIKTILVTSSVANEGKTFTATGLAGVFAQEHGKRVILIDADMRKPKPGRSFGLNRSNGDIGLSKVLLGEEDSQEAVILSIDPAFYFMPAGPLPSNPSELLSSQNLERTLKSAAANFDWVIVDSPPVLGLSDTSSIAPLCDAVVLIVRAGSTPSKLILNAIDQIGQDRLCGIVLNRQKRTHSSRYYYNYYYRSRDGGKRDKRS